MSKSIDSSGLQNDLVRPLVKANLHPELKPDPWSYYVLVSHEELDNLVARLMATYDLNGDVKQREALKSVTKEKCRSWLDELYNWSGYEQFTGPTEQARVIEDKR